MLLRANTKKKSDWSMMMRIVDKWCIGALKARVSLL